MENTGRNRFLSVVNSPFFLWMLSAFFITCLGAYLTAHQECVREAKRIGTTYPVLLGEIQYRMMHIADAVSSAERLDQLPDESAHPIRYGYSQFKDATMRELYFQLTEVQGWMHFPDGDADFTEAIKGTELADHKNFGMANWGYFPDGLTDRDLPELKRYVSRLEEKRASRNGMIELKYLCTSPSALWEFAYFGWTPILRAKRTLTDLNKRVENEGPRNRQ
jgi:hypothetical protein